MDSKKPSKIRALNKLGSDNIHEILEPQGGKAITRTLSDEEFKIALFNKLQEEVTEFLEDPIAPSFAYLGLPAQQAMAGCRKNFLIS